MYKLIKARPEHAKQIVPYLTITCYWKEFVEGNNLKMSYEDFMLEWIVNPRIPYTTVLVEEGKEDIVRGCVITATTEQFASMPDYTPHLHPRVMEVFAPWFEHPISDSVVLELYAVDKELRGQGYGSKLYQVVEYLAKSEKKDCISCFVWSCFPDSMIVCTRKGMIVTECIKFADPVEIPLLYLEKTPEYAQLKDYFQTSDYLNKTNILGVL